MKTNLKRWRWQSIFLAICVFTTMLSMSSVMGVAADGDIAINAANFPDQSFRQYVLENIDLNNDGALAVEERDSVSIINIQDMGCGSLQGIEYFTKLGLLNCAKNKLTSLDLSGNPALMVLSCGCNKLTTLNVSDKPALEWLYCDENELTSLNVSNNPALERLDCTNNKLTSLDVSSNPVLGKLGCANNKLTLLDVSSNPALERLGCGDNKLTKLDVSNNPYLDQLTCANNKLTQLDVSKNLGLSWLICENNKLSSLDLSNNPWLEGVLCDKNELMSLNLSDKLYLNFFPVLEAGEEIVGQSRSLDVPSPSVGFDLLDFDPNIDPNKISDFQGGVLNGTKVTGYTAGVTSVTYTYDVDNEGIETPMQVKLTLTSEQVPSPHTVIFKDFDGTVLKIQENVESGTAAIPPSAPVREGYKFVGWSVEFDEVVADTVVTAQYEKIDETEPSTSETTKVDETEPSTAETTKPGNTDNPKTGDATNVLLGFVLLLVSGAGIFGVMLYTQKKSKNIE